MKTEKTIVTITCDVCGKDISEYGKAQPDEISGTCVELIYSDYYVYNKRYVKDLCRECNKKIVEFVRELSGKPNKLVGHRER